MMQEMQSVQAFTEQEYRDKLTEKDRERTNIRLLENKQCPYCLVRGI
jgi:hypothetical protein